MVTLGKIKLTITHSINRLSGLSSEGRRRIMRSVSGRCGGRYPVGYTSGQVGDIRSEIKARCLYEFKKKDMKKKVCRKCVKLHGFCKLLRSATTATREPGRLGSCLGLRGD